jgi:hypothetical protein
MVHVTNRPDVAMRLVPLKLFLSHGDARRFTWARAAMPDRGRG